MKAILLRVGSLPIHSSLAGSPRVYLSVNDSLRDVFCGGKKKKATSPRMSLHFESSRRNGTLLSIRRAFSESSVIRESEVPESETSTRFGGDGSRSFLALEEDLSEGEEGTECSGSLRLSERGIDRSHYAGSRRERGTAVEDLGYGDGGDGDDSGIGTLTGGSADRSKIGAYYQEMLKSNPTNSLLLSNYGKFLHEVEKDAVQAELYYARAILANPGDGEVLSRYGKLIWETERDEDRAKSYFDRAVQASPDDCMVLGSYAHFMWEAEEEG